MFSINKLAFAFMAVAVLIGGIAEAAAVPVELKVRSGFAGKYSQSSQSISSQRKTGESSDIFPPPCIPKVTCLQ